MYFPRLANLEDNDLISGSGGKSKWGAEEECLQKTPTQMTTHLPPNFLFLFAQRFQELLKIKSFSTCVSGVYKPFISESDFEIIITSIEHTAFTIGVKIILLIFTLNFNFLLPFLNSSKKVNTIKYT